MTRPKSLAQFILMLCLRDKCASSLNLNIMINSAIKPLSVAGYCGLINYLSRARREHHELITRFNESF